MQTLLAPLAAELERPRELSPQVLKHLAGVHAIERDGLGAFLTGALPKLEDYEVDLILAPLFTPALRDQAVFAERLGAEACPAAEWPALISALVARPTSAPLVAPGGETHAVPLRDVTVGRYVRRLRLDAAIPPALFNLLSHLPPATDRPLLKAAARRAIWESEPRREILVRYLARALGGDAYRLDDALELLKLAETYEPSGLADLLGHIPHWQKVLRHEISVAASPKPFFNERVQELHGGGRDQRRTDDTRLDAKRRELDALDRLLHVLAPPPNS